MDSTHLDTSLVREVRAMLCELFFVTDPDDLRDDVSLLAGGILDSTGVLELVSEIGERFGIDMDDDEIIPENLDSVANLIQFISLRRSA